MMKSSAGWTAYGTFSSIVENEIELVQQTPVQVFSALLAILLDPLGRESLLLRQRVARERRQVKIIDNLRACLVRFHQLINQAAVGGRHSFSYKRAIHQRHRLQDRTARLAVELFAVGLPEGAQEALRLAVVYVFRRRGLSPETRRSDRRVVDVILAPVIAEDLCGLRDRVMNLFGGQQLDVVAREVRRVTLLPFAIFLMEARRELIRARPRDRAHQVFQAEAMLGEIARQRVEQFIVRRLTRPRRGQRR